MYASYDKKDDKTFFLGICTENFIYFDLNVKYKTLLININKTRFRCRRKINLRTLATIFEVPITYLKQNYLI